jgi:hypothetical protein
VSTKTTATRHPAPLNTVKLLDRGEADHEPPGYTDEELEELLGEGGTSDEDV